MLGSAFAARPQPRHVVSGLGSFSLHNCCKSNISAYTLRHDLLERLCALLLLGNCRLGAASMMFHSRLNILASNICHPVFFSPPEALDPWPHSQLTSHPPRFTMEELILPPWLALLSGTLP